MYCSTCVTTGEQLFVSCLPTMSTLLFTWVLFPYYTLREGEGGGGGQQSFIWRGSTLRSNPFPIYQYPIIDRKSSPFLYLPNYCKCAVFEIWRDCKPERFFRLFKDIKCICNPFRAFLQTEKTWFPYPFIWFRQQWNPYLFYLKPEKGSPLGRSLPVQTNVGSFP